MICALRAFDGLEMRENSRASGTLPASPTKHRAHPLSRPAGQRAVPEAPMWACIPYFPLRISWFLAAVWTAPATSLLFAR